MLFPQFGPENYDEKDKSILAKMSSFYAESIAINQAFWGEADTDTRFEAGDQTLWNDLYANLPANRRRQFNFNRIKRVINMISGHQRRNRKSTIVVPVENGDAETADQFSKIMLWINQQEGMLETVSESFQGALVTGMNLLQVWVDYRSDPISGNVKIDNCSYNSFLIDPFFRKADLSDCNALWKRSFLTKRECAALLPDQEELIMSLAANDSRDGKFQFMPESYNYGLKNLLTYDEFYYRDYRKQKMLVDTQTGEVLEWKSADSDRLNEFLRQYPQVTVIEQDVPTVRVAIVVQGKVAYDGPNPLGIDTYPFVPVFAYYTPQLPYFPWRIQGVVRGLRDAQYLYNRRKIIELDIFESQINSGWKYKENALVNPKDIFQSGQGRGLALKEEAMMSDVEQIMPPQVPPSMIQLSDSLAREVQEISGVNEELLGSAVDEKAGILSMLRQGAGLTTLQGLFDQLDRSQKLLGKIVLDVVQNNFTPGKVKRIIEQEPTIQFYNKAFGKYDASVEEGLNTTTQRQMQLVQLLQLKETGIPIPDDILLDACTVQDKKKLVDSIAKARQAQEQAQQAKMQAEVQESMARADLAHSRSMADQGLGLERLSRIQENKAMAIERKAAAVRDENASVLDMVKAIKEIEGIDVSHMNTLMSMLNIIKQQESQSQQEINAVSQVGQQQNNPISEAQAASPGEQQLV
jgi:hypothetical protein